MLEVSAQSGHAKCRRRSDLRAAAHLFPKMQGDPSTEDLELLDEAGRTHDLQGWQFRLALTFIKMASSLQQRTGNPVTVRTHEGIMALSLATPCRLLLEAVTTGSHLGFPGGS